VAIPFDQLLERLREPLDQLLRTAEADAPG
jgi:hypothetical protein